MGRRGPPPTPTEILNQRGSWRGKTKARKAEPKPETPAPNKPAWLLPLAAQEWDRVAPELQALKLLTAIDWASFAAYCQTYAHWVAAEQWMEVNGTVMTFKDRRGKVKYSAPVAQWGIAQKALEKMRQFAREFGLSPASRVGLPGPAAKEDDGAAELAAILGAPQLKVTG